MQLDESVVLEKPGAQRIVIVVDGTLAIDNNDTEEDMVNEGEVPATVCTPAGAPGHVITCPAASAVPAVLVNSQGATEQPAIDPVNEVDFLHNSRPIRPSPVSGSTEYELIMLPLGAVKAELVCSLSHRQ